MMALTTFSRKKGLAGIRNPILFASILCAALSAAAQTQPRYLVDTETDAHDTNPGDGVCRTSQNECSLRAAIEENEASPAFSDWGIITLPAGTYTLTLGQLSIRTNTTIEGEGMGATTIDANHARAFFLPGEIGYNFFLLNLTIVNAEDMASNGASPALYVSKEANVNLYRVGIYNSRAGWIAGAILNNGYLTMTECQLVRNSAPRHDASGVEGSGGAIVNSGTLILRRTTFQANEGTQGGAIFNGGRI